MFMSESSWYSSHSVAVGSEGGVWTWGDVVYLGHYKMQPLEARADAPAWCGVCRGQSGDGGRGEYAHHGSDEQGGAVGQG